MTQQASGMCHTAVSDDSSVLVATIASAIVAIASAIVAKF